MATLSPFIKTASSPSSSSSTSSPMISPLTSAIKKTSRLSLLSSDIDDDLGILDLENDPRFAHISRDEFWLLDDNEYDPKIHNFDIVLEWINADTKTMISDDDEFFRLPVNGNGHNGTSNHQYSNNHHQLNKTFTPINGYNRFEYLTKSISRTATITKRRIDPCEFETPPNTTIPNSNARYGTITKGTISRGHLANNHNDGETPPTSLPGNRTYVVDTKIRFSNDNNMVDSQQPTQILASTPNTPNNGNYAANTNTITKYNKRVLNVSLGNINQHVRQQPANLFIHNDEDYENDCYSSSDNNNYNSDFNANLTTATTTTTDLDSDFGGEFTDNDLQPKLNRTFDVDSSNSQQTSDDQASTATGYSSNDGSSSRNYPTISRNITKTLLRREASQGNMLNNNNNGKSTQQKKVYLVSSNDDLLNSDCSSRSNLSSMTSSIGRSEPNLIDVQHSQLSVHQQKQPSRISNLGQMKKTFQSRLIGPTEVNNVNNNGGVCTGRQIPTKSRIARPSIQPLQNNGGTMVKNKISNIQPPSATTGSFGNINSLPSTNISPYNMPRTTSQIEMNEDEDYYNNNDMVNGNNSQQQSTTTTTTNRLMSGLDRKSTFRVHRPSSMSTMMPMMATMVANVQTSLFSSTGIPQQKPQAKQQQQQQPVAVNQRFKATMMRGHQNRSSNETMMIANDDGVSKNDDNKEMDEKMTNNQTLVNGHNKPYISTLRIHNNQQQNGIQKSMNPSSSSQSTTITTTTMINNNIISNNNTNNPNYLNNNTNFALNNNLNNNNSVITSRIPALISTTALASNKTNRSSIPVCGKEPSNHRQPSNNNNIVNQLLTNNNNNNHESVPLQRKSAQHQQQQTIKVATSALPLMAMGAGKTTILPVSSSSSPHSLIINNPHNHQKNEYYSSLDSFNHANNHHRNNHGRNNVDNAHVDDDDNSWQDECY